jgi:hypothetical protein
MPSGFDFDGPWPDNSRHPEHPARVRQGRLVRF